MNFIDVMTVVGALVGIINLIIQLASKWAKITHFFKEHDLLWRGYLFFAGVFSVLFGFVIYSSIALHIFGFGFAVIVVLMVWALLGVWGPALQRLKHAGINKTVNIVQVCLVVLILIAFWITQWPKWYVPTVLTSLVVILVLFVLVDNLIKKRKARKSQ